MGDEEGAAAAASLPDALGVVWEPSPEADAAVPCCWEGPARVGVEAAELFAGRPRRREEAGDDIALVVNGRGVLYRSGVVHGVVVLITLKVFVGCWMEGPN